MRVELEIEGLDEVKASLRATGDRLAQPLQPLLQAVADLWITDFQANFERQGFDGQAWPKLAAMTQDLRRRRGFNPEHPILVRTSDLLQSIRIQSQTEDEVVVGSNLRYAGVNQFGGPEDYPEDVPGPREVPPRPFVGITADLLADTETTIDAYFFGEDAHAA